MERKRGFDKYPACLRIEIRTFPYFSRMSQKGVAAIRLTMWITGGNPYAVALSALFVVCGHNWPIFLNYRGGKGIAASLGIMLALNYRIALVLFGIAILTMILSKMVSLGSILGLALSPFAFWAMHQPVSHVLICAGLAAMGIFQHRGNIGRIIRGEENKISLSKTKKD
jgi:glycerol-3-phosphate acyltransferase PlsY